MWPQLPQGYKWAEGRPTTLQKTTRPDKMWEDVWRLFRQKAKIKL